MGISRKFFISVLILSFSFNIVFADKLSRLFIPKNDGHCVKIEFSNNKKYILLSAIDNYTIIDYKTKKVLKSIYESTGRFPYIKFINNHDIAYIAERKIILYNLLLDKIINKIDIGKSYFNISSFDVSPNKKKIIIAVDNRVELWDINKPKKINFFEEHSDRISKVRFIDNSQFLSSSLDHTLKLWSKDSIESIYTFNIHNKFVNTFNVTQNGNYFYSISNDRRMKLIDIKSRKTIKTIEIPKLTYNFTSNKIYNVFSILGKKIKIFNQEKYIDTIEGEIPLLVSKNEFVYLTKDGMLAHYNIAKKISSLYKTFASIYDSSLIEYNEKLYFSNSSGEYNTWDIKNNKVGENYKSSVTPNFDAIDSLFTRKTLLNGEKVIALLNRNMMSIEAGGKIKVYIQHNNEYYGGEIEGKDYVSMAMDTYQNILYMGTNKGEIYKISIVDALSSGKNIKLVSKVSSNSVERLFHVDKTNTLIYETAGFTIGIIPSTASNTQSTILKKNYLNGIIVNSFTFGRKIFTIDSYGNIYAYDYSDNKYKFIKSLIIRVLSTSLDFKNKKLFVLSNTGVITMYKNEFFNKEIDIVPFADNNWLLMTEEGYFTGSKNAAKYLNITKTTKDGLEPFDFSQLYDHFFRPDLVKLKLEGKEKEYQKAIAGMTYQEALKNPPPKLSFRSIDSNSINTSKEKIKLSFNVSENGGGVGIIRVYQEGKLIQTIGKGKINKQSANIDTILADAEKDTLAKQKQSKYMLLASKSLANDINMSIEDTVAKVKSITTNNKAGIYTIDVELKSGKNEISIEAFNKTNTVTSYRENLIVNANIPKHKPKLYAIVVGINNFEAPNVENLQYSENDAQAIKSAAEKRMGNLFSDVEVKYLTGKNVTKKNILKAAKEIAKVARLDDTVLFYISTHGRAYKGKLYLVPYNNANVKNWIDFEETFQAVQSAKALNQIFIIDACESGQANDIVSSVYDSRASVLANSLGVHVLLASTKGTYAFEHSNKNIKHGVFTYKILQALKDKETDINKDSLISILEISKKLQEPVNNTEYQYPVIRNVGRDIQLENIR